MWSTTPEVWNLYSVITTSCWCFFSAWKNCWSRRWIWKTSGWTRCKISIRRIITLEQRRWNRGCEAFRIVVWSPFQRCFSIINLILFCRPYTYSYLSKNFFVPKKFRSLQVLFLCTVVFIGTMLFALQQLSGINAVFYFSSTVFKSAGVPSDAANICVGIANLSGEVTPRSTWY